MTTALSNDTAAPNELSFEERIEALVEQKVAERLAQLQSSIEQNLANARAAAVAASTDRATLLVFSGDLDRVMAAFIIAVGAAAMGTEVSMFFTFWGLPILKKTTIWSGKTVSEKLLTTLLPANASGARTSKLKMMGLGSLLLKKIMSQQHVESLPTLMTVAREMGVRLIACQMTMGVMGITKEELFDIVTYGGVTTFLAEVSDSNMTLFI
jgi:peroxiredoxin family protein